LLRRASQELSMLDLSSFLYSWERNCLFKGAGGCWYHCCIDLGLFSCCVAVFCLWMVHMPSGRGSNSLVGLMRALPVGELGLILTFVCQQWERAFCIYDPFAGLEIHSFAGGQYAIIIGGSLCEWAIEACSSWRCSSLTGRLAYWVRPNSLTHGSSEMWEGLTWLGEDAPFHSNLLVGSNLYDRLNLEVGLESPIY